MCSIAIQLCDEAYSFEDNLQPQEYLQDLCVTEVRGATQDRLNPSAAYREK